MAEIPVAMQTLQKPTISEFRRDERLFRRFRPDHWEDGGVAAEAFKLPNMSVNRERLGPPEWAILTEEDEYTAWGVASFRVEEIPHGIEMMHLGVIVFTFEPRHVPIRKNYPHSEVWVFREGIHICGANKNADLLDPEFHLRWRERLSQLADVVIQPTRED
ncbi:MAG: hypothetical protein U0793_13050 [Gemmataceae bacterium]